MESRGRGIFLGVVSVATLIVAIIGATFAYFVASTSGNTGAATAGAASVEGTITMTEVLDARTNMIPVTEGVVQQSYAQSGTGARAKCAGVSAAGGDTPYNLCSLYTFTVTNSASVAQTVYVSLKTETNTIPNLWYALYDDNGTLVQNEKAVGTDTLQSDGTTAGAANALGTFKKVPAVGSTDLNVTSALLNATSGSVTYTLMLYIHEIDGNQTSADSGNAFTGTISVTSSDGTNNITGRVLA